jgi:hypothetical protein
MAIFTNSITALNSSFVPITQQTYAFIDMIGSIQVPTEQLEVTQRGGVPGSFISRLGLHGRPFQLITINYVADFAAAAAAQVAYNALKSVDYGVKVIKQSVTYPDPLQVLDVVEAEPPRGVSKTVGGFTANTPNEVRQVMRWTLLA